MATTDDIKARVDLIDVVADYVPDLKRSGRNYHARCPFHQENTPSFVVFPERQTWRCFGACATGGDVFSFVMKIEAVEFPDALKSLAERAGVALPERRRAEGSRNPLYAVNDAALRFFRDALQADRGSLARAYVDQRGLTEESLIRWGMGYAPSSGDELLKHMEAMGFSEEQLIAAGVANRLESGQVRDMFRGRLMFALRDPEGEVIAFAGRSLDGTNPKYINTAQTSIFDKSHLLYGMDRARDAIAKEGVAVVVEGYMDVITAHEHDYRNVVASMGTALTEHQVAQLRARSPRVVLALDADAAGQEAMLRSLRSSWQLLGSEVEAARGRARQELKHRSSDMEVLRIALITEGKDPDELIRNDSAGWRDLIANAVPAVDFMLHAETARINVTTVEGKAEAVELLMPVIYAIPNWVEQERYFGKLAELLAVPVATLEASVGRTRNVIRPQRRAQSPRADDRARVESVLAAADHDALDEHALSLLVHYPALLERAAELDVEHMARPENRAVLSAFQRTGTIEGTYAQLDGQLAEHLEALGERVLPPADRKQLEADWQAGKRRLEERHLRELKAQEEVALAGEPTDDAPLEPGYREAVDRQALATNERLRDLFVSGTGASSSYAGEVPPRS
jgi:DNA primase